MRTRSRSLSLCALAAALFLTADLSALQAEETPPRRPLLEAAQMGPMQEWQSSPEPGNPVEFTGAESGWMQTFWDKHKWHLLTTFLMVETDYLYAKHVGTSRSPLLFGDPTGIDSSVDSSLYRADLSVNFVENNKTNLLQALAIGSI